MMKICLLFLSLLILLAGCAHIISDKTLAQADRNVTFNELRENPGAFVGKTVLLGGRLTDVTRSSEGTQLEVVEYKLDNIQMPLDSFCSGLRFLAFTPESLNTAVYKPGKFVTMAGEFAGKKKVSIKGVECNCLVVNIKELHAVDIWTQAQLNYPYWRGAYGD